MNKLHLITSLFGFHVVTHAMMEVDPSNFQATETTSTNVPSHNILPLTLVHLDNQFTAPNEMVVKPGTTGPPFLNGDVTFTKNSKGEQIFLCRIIKRKRNEGNPNQRPSEDDYCVYPIEFNNSDPLKCTLEPIPIISKLKVQTSPITYTDDVPCGGRSGQGKVYRFVYKVCITKDPIQSNSLQFGSFFTKKVDIIKRFEFEIYRVCIDDKNGGKLLYTEHRISSPKLLNHPNLYEEQQKVYPMIVGRNNHFELPQDQLEIQYNNIDQTKGETQEFVEAVMPGMGTPLYKPQKFVSPDDFAFALWRKPTFDYLNVKRMKYELEEIWEHINLLIRQDAIKRNRDYYIYTSAGEISLFQTQELRTNQTKEGSSEPPKVPVQYWLKKIYHLPDEMTENDNLEKQKKAIAIMVDSNFKDCEEDELELNARCGENLCPNAFDRRFPLLFTHIRCCSLIKNEFLGGQNHLKIDSDLELDFIYELQIEGNYNTMYS